MIEKIIINNNFLYIFFLQMNHLFLRVLLYKIFKKLILNCQLCLCEFFFKNHFVNFYVENYVVILKNNQRKSFLT